jgi:hypothetical protein
MINESDMITNTEYNEFLKARSMKVVQNKGRWERINEKKK